MSKKHLEFLSRKTKQTQNYQRLSQSLFLILDTAEEKRLRWYLLVTDPKVGKGNYSHQNLRGIGPTTDTRIHGCLSPVFALGIHRLQIYGFIQLQIQIINIT